MASRLEVLIRYLAEARLISGGTDGSFALTERGRAPWQSIRRVSIPPT